MRGKVYTGVLAALFAADAAQGQVVPFVTYYKNNTTANATEATNPVLNLLSGYDQLWTPGSTWYNGTPTAVGAPVLNYNNSYVVNATVNRTPAQAASAYYDDRRNQSFTIVNSGLGPVTSDYLAGSGAFTTITSIPADATTVAYNDGGNGAGSTSSSLGSVVSLIGTLRGSYSSTTPPKNYFDYPRPFRQIDNATAGNPTVVFQNGATPTSSAAVLASPSSFASSVVVDPTLVPVISGTPASDGAYPSGHSNAGYLTALAMAYAFPERFQQLLASAADLGNNRIVAGMHSPLDVMAGRMEATALAAAILNDPANATLKAQAYSQAQSYFQTATGTTSFNALNAVANSGTTATDPFADYAANKANYNYDLTYGFSQINSTTVPATVPQGAEVLLETRQPYLTAAQRREVLRTTEIASGYPVLDDPEGWGRLNLFAAADGYGRFDSDVTVNMDASQGGFSAQDSWRNDISGVGKLTKQGTGSLTLTGNNSYQGGTEIDGGTLAGQSPTAFGTGDVLVSGGTLADLANGTLELQGTYTQLAGGALSLDITGSGQASTFDLSVAGDAAIDGTLDVDFANGFSLPGGQTTFDLISSGGDSGAFATVNYSGLPAGYSPQIIYNGNNVQLQISAVPEPTSLSVIGLASAALLSRRRKAN